LLRLQSMVGEDSSDPLKRCRVALGKLVWKRNLLVRKSMDSDLSDAELCRSIVKKPLLSLPPPDAGVDTEEEHFLTEIPEPSPEEKALIEYIQNLHFTELHLRRLVTKTLAEIPVTIIATAADERPNTVESMDLADFEDPTGIEWLTVGHDLLKAIIFRPAVSGGNSTDLTPCFWYEIQGYSKSIESEAEEKDELDSKQRRMRFRAIPIPPPGEEYAEQEGILILTEAQVHAGLKAAELETRNRSNVASDGNPFSGAAGDRITLIPVDAEEDATVPEINGRIVGYDNVYSYDDNEIEYRILLLPDSVDGKPQDSFWAILDVRADTSSYVCQPIGNSNVWYSIEQFDYHNGSAAHQQCESVLAWLSRQAKAGPFAEPVDPVALNIPSYPLIVKHPMDISTMREKLENGQYSSILPGETKGINPVSKMLNGPFRKDLELIFDNAMLFNPPDDWIYQAAAQLKKNTLKKIAELSQTADHKVSGAGRLRQKKSVYVDDDSDVDIYEYESENDDDFDTGGRRDRKRKRSSRAAGLKDEFAARAVEQPIRLQATLRDAGDLRGPFANLPINLSASSYSLPPQWSCRCATAIPETEEPGAAKKRTKEMLELLELQKIVQANESASLRRSTRAVDVPSTNSRTKKNQGAPLEFSFKGMVGQDFMKTLPTSRLDVEIQAEMLHEDYYSKLYQQYSNSLVARGGMGAYANASFPPYLGRVLPLSNWDEVSWEIRSPFVVPALRWVLRGLIQSGHLTATENLGPDFSSGVILTNDIYYFDTSLRPFEVLDLRELQRKKRANREGFEESDDEVEMSEYEKARADRVARNAERLKALGLA
jgi:Bromodomain